MKKLTTLLTFLFLLFGIVGGASATSFTFDMGSESYFSGAAMSDPGLVMWANVYDSVQNENFTLSAGENYTFEFAMIGTKEDWVHDDDIQTQAITAHVDFDIPDTIQNVNGSTVGFSGSWSYYQGWNLTWDGPATYVGPNGLEFIVSLSNASFISELWTGPDGLCGTAYADITATVSLVTSPVPEPTSIMLLGLGLAGIVGIGRKKIFKR